MAIAPRGYPLSAGSDTPADRGVRRRTPTSVGLIATGCRAGQAVVGAIANRLVHGAAGDGCSAGSIESVRLRTLSLNSGRAGRSTISPSSSTHVRARIAIPDVEVVIGTGHDWREAVEDRRLGNRRHAAAGIRRGRTGGSGIPRLGRLENPAARPGPRDDRSDAVVNYSGMFLWRRGGAVPKSNPTDR
mgnify:CR=1 FL=1